MERTLPRPSLTPLLVVWFFVALALAALRVIAGRPPLVGIALFLQIVGALVAYRRSEAFRAAVDALPTRALILLHVVRAPIGAAFVVMFSRGLLHSSFGLRGGVGDLVAGLAALAVSFAWERKRLVLAWNVYAFLDIVATVATAQKLALVDHDPITLSSFGFAPFGMLPFFVVPLVVLSHLAIFARLR